MNKNIKKGKIAPNNLIALGNNNKARTALPLQTQQPKKAKTDDLNPKTFVTTIEQNIKQDIGLCESTLNSYMTSLKTSLVISNKPIKIYLSQCLALLHICKRFPTLFTKPSVVESLANILSYNGKEQTPMLGLSSSYKPQSSLAVNPTTAGKMKPLHITICNIIVFSFKDLRNWPVQFVKAYLDDSFSDRVWVDIPECYLFVQNLETAFPNPGIEPRTLFPLSAFSENVVDVINFSEGITTTNEQLIDQTDMKTCNIFNKLITQLSQDDYLKSRYDNCRPTIDQMVAGWIKDIVERRFMADTQSRPIIRTFCSLAGMSEIRGAAVIKCDNWLSTAKLQTSTLNMLTIMASSCTQSIIHNTNDINFCVYLMFRFKYKLSKPPVQAILLECVKKITETHPNNLRNILEIYMNNEIYGSPTVNAGTTINSSTTSNIVPVVYSAQNKSGPVSVTFPAIFFRFPSESIKILGELVHEQMCILYNDIKPVKLFIRDICRWIKVAHLNTNGVYTCLTNNGVLPDSLELHDLAQILLADRSNNEALIARMNDFTFKQIYAENMINIVCELQMLSVIRPNLKEIFNHRTYQDKKDYESLKSHYNTLRQIRYFTCKWLKTVYRLVEAHVTTDQMTNYLKQVLFLNVTRNNDFSYVVDESYTIGDIWNTEPDKMMLIKGLTEVPLSDKLVSILINLGFEKHLCVRPSEIVNMVSELMVRAAASANGDIIPMNLTKGEVIINNMFACCSYDAVMDENDSKHQIARTLAYKSSFWKVCQALVVMSSYCTTTCGSYLWNYFPTVRNLMQIIITNNFDELYNDREAMETERQLCDTDSKKICEFETMLGEAGMEEAPIIDGTNSKLVHLLLFNLPQGPVRQPPTNIIESLKSINSIMKIGDRLSQCRNPDFLYEIVREQDQSRISSRKWIIDLVKKTSEHNLDGLPLLCLTEFIYHDLYEKMINNWLIVSNNDSTDVCLKRLVLKIRQILCSTDGDDKKKIDNDNLKNIVSALSNSFFNRLSDSCTFTRKVARECLYILLQSVGSPIKLMETAVQFVDTLKSIMNLYILKDNVLICSVAEALRETLKFETDIDVLHSYVDLFALMSSGNHKEWLANTVETLSILILNRPIIADKLRSRDYENVSKGKTSSTLISDSLAEIFLAHINYTAFQAQVVPLEHRDEAVMVHLKDKQFPVVVKVIQSQLALICWGVSKSKKFKKLVDFWITKVGNKYQLPNFTSIDANGIAIEVIPEWLVNAAVNSSTIPVMMAILYHHVYTNKKISHSLTPAIYFMPNDFIKSYLNFMNSLVKSDQQLIDDWLSHCNSISKLSSMLTTVTKMYTKVKGVDILFKSTLEDHIVPGNQSLLKPNLEPKIIVMSMEKPKDQIIANVMEIDIDKDNVWNTVIQQYSSDHKNSSTIQTISESISNLLSTKPIDMVKCIENLFKLLKDPKTHSETLRVLNKADFKLMPLLKLTFKSYDQNSFDIGMQSFRYLFNSYPHIEKSTMWKVIYNLSLVQGMMVANYGDISMNDEDNSSLSTSIKFPMIVKSLAKSIMQGNVEDVARIGPKIDQLTILGLGNGHFTDSHFDIIHKLLFSSHALNQYSDYFMSDLLHQSNVDCLRQILHSILNRKNISQLNASRVLDFITACLAHPRLQYSVVLPPSNRHIWPQQNMEIDITEYELINLLNLVISEAEHLIEQNGPSAKCVNKCLNKRSHLIDTCSSSNCLVKDRYVIINRFLDSKSHNHVVEKFGFALYSRIPNLILLCPSPFGREYNTVEAVITNVDSYHIKEIHKIGQRLLSGLISPRNDLQDLAIQACKALLIRHPKLCVQLLPYMCALSDGALDGTDSWIDFRKKRGPVLYSNLLHLLEIMIPYSLSLEPTIRTNIKRILLNFLRVLIRYHDQPKVFLGFVARLVTFMEKMIPLEESKDSTDDNDFITEHTLEITALSKVYSQFRNLIVYAQRNKDICSNLLSVATVGDLDDSRVSQMAIRRSDLLMNFRKQIREIQTGNGILVKIKDLEDVSKRDTNSMGLFLDDLRSLINHSMNDVRIAAVQILARYLNGFPEQASRIISDCIMPNMLKSTWYWSRPFANLTLKTLCQTGMLAPNIVPTCLTNHARLLVSGNNGRGNFRESIELLEVIVDNISLESFMESMASYTCKPILKKETTGTNLKRHYQDTDTESHKAKRSRFK